jgi:hypothetical protein
MITNSSEHSCLICLEDLSDDIYRVKHFECNYYLHSKCYKMINKCLYCKEPFNNKAEFHYRYLNHYNIDLNDSIYLDYLNDYIHRSIFITPALENGTIKIIKLILIIIQSFIISFGIIMPNIIVILIMNQLKIFNIRFPSCYLFFITIQIMITMLYIHTIRRFYIILNT